MFRANASVKATLKNRKKRNVCYARWESMFIAEATVKATSKNRKKRNEGHASRFHAACDGKGATMPVVKVHGNYRGVLMAAGFNPLAQTLGEVKYSRNESVIYRKGAYGPTFTTPSLMIGTDKKERLSYLFGPSLNSVYEKGLLRLKV
jgi:hypothetical protein